jgi:hypothetical protein
LAQKDLRAEIHEADIRGLLKKSAKTIANEIAARTFKLNVDDLKLRAPRHRTRPKKTQ